MSISGQPYRTAVQDGNESRVDVPSLRDTVRGQGIQADTAADPDLSKEKLGLTLAKTLGKQFVNFAVKKDAEKFRDQEIQGAFDQGEDTALSDITKLKKRTGLGEFFLGQDSSYVGAQRRAVQNNIKSWATAELTEVEQHADKPPKTYRKRLSDKYAEHAKDFKGDEETLSMLKASYMQASETLMAAYTKERYAHTIKKNEDTTRDSIAEGTDLLVTLYNQDHVTPEAQKALGEAWAKHYSYEEYKNTERDPDLWISPEKFKEYQAANIVSNLEDNNVQAYEAAKEMGYLETLPRSVQATVRNAHESYRTRTDLVAAEESVHLELAAMNMSIDDGGKVVQQRFNEIKAASEELHRKNPYKHNAAQHQKVLLKAAHRLLGSEYTSEKGKEVAEWRLAAEEKFTKGQHARYNLLTEATKKKADAYIISLRLGQPIKEGEEPDRAALTKQIQYDPAIQKRIALTNRGTEKLEGIQKIALESGIEELANMGNLFNNSTLADGTQGTINDKGRAVLNMFDEYEKVQPGIVSNTVSKEQYLQLQYMRHLVEKNQPTDTIFKAMQEFNPEEVKAEFKKPGKKEDSWVAATKDEGYRKIWTDATGMKFGDPSPEELADIRDDYNLGIAFLKDHKKAVWFAQGQIKAKNTNFSGRTVKNGKKINNQLVEFSTNEPYIEATADSDLADYLWDDPNNPQGVENTPRSMDELLAYAEDKMPNGWMPTLYGQLGLAKDKINTSKFVKKALSRSEVDMEVRGDEIFFKARSMTGVKIAKWPISRFKELQRQFNIAAYIEQQRAIRNKIANVTTVASPLGSEVTERGGKVRVTP